MRNAILLAVILTLANSAFAKTQEVPPHVMSKTEFSLFLQSLHTDLPLWRSTLSKVDPSSLKLNSSQEGKDIQFMRDSCLTTLDKVSDDVSALSERNLLTLQIMLLVDLNNLQSIVGAFTIALGYANPVANAYTVGLWQGSLKEMSVSQMKPLAAHLNDHLLALALTIDKKFDITAVSG